MTLCAFATLQGVSNVLVPALPPLVQLQEPVFVGWWYIVTVSLIFAESVLVSRSVPLIARKGAPNSPVLVQTE